MKKSVFSFSKWSSLLWCAVLLAHVTAPASVLAQTVSQDQSPSLARYID